MVAILGIAGLSTAAWRVPAHLRPTSRIGWRDQVEVLRQGRLTLAFFTTALGFTGTYVVFTYLVPILEQISRFPRIRGQPAAAGLWHRCRAGERSRRARRRPAGTAPRGDADLHRSSARPTRLYGRRPQQNHRRNRRVSSRRLRGGGCLRNTIVRHRSRQTPCAKFGGSRRSAEYRLHQPRYIGGDLLSAGWSRIISASAKRPG